MSAIQSDAERLAIHREIETEGELTPAQASPHAEIDLLIARVQVARDLRARYRALREVADEAKRRADMAFDEYSAAVDALG